METVIWIARFVAAALIHQGIAHVIEYRQKYYWKLRILLGTTYKVGDELIDRSEEKDLTVDDYETLKILKINHSTYVAEITYHNRGGGRNPITRQESFAKYQLHQYYTKVKATQVKDDLSNLLA